MHTRRERAVIVLTNSLKARFFAKTAKKESGCIEWTGCVSPTGYGKFRLSDGPQDAHVVAWRMANGGIPVPVGKLVMHSCDNRQCVNAEHLSLGTTSDNMIDCRDKGRLGYAVGEDTYNAVLTDDLVRAIWALFKPRRFGHVRIAQMLGLKPGCVDAVLRGRTWKHVSPDLLAAEAQQIALGLPVSEGAAR